VISTAPTSGPTLAAQPRLHGLDALRGLAALCVVLWHWTHFFYDGTQPGALDAGSLPWATFFAPFYRGGWLMVDLFFSLSGFIFFSLYAEAIAARRVSFRDFGVLRLSRLYPLHFVTLLTVAGGQWAMLALQGRTFVYGADAAELPSQLLLVHSWAGDQGIGFNGPSWSISIEVLLYLVFFGFCRLGFRRGWQIALMALLGAGVALIGPQAVSRGVFSFFCGGLAHSAVGWVRARGLAGARGIWLAVASGSIALALYLLNTGAPLLYRIYRLLCGELLLIHGRDLIGGALLVLSPYLLTGVVFPTLIAALALAERGDSRLSRIGAWLGDVSYSSYLWHFPLQLLLVGAVTATGASRDIFRSPLALVLFLGSLLLVAHASHRWLEAPAQAFFRRKFLAPRPSSP